MAASWGQYATSGFLLLQGFLCLHLYLSQISLVARLDSLQPHEGIEHRGRREIRSAELFENALLVQNVSVENATTEAPIRRKHHKKAHRVPAERYYVSMESTTTGPVMIRSSRTKLTSRSRSHSRQTEDHVRQVAKLREDSAPFSGEFHSLPPVAVHFVADASNYTRERHPHYAGNGRIKVSGTYSDWKPAEWTHTLGTNQHFNMNQGKVSVEQAGLYLLYAQIHYANVQEVNCFRAIHNGATVAQCCSTTAHPDKHEVKANTCSLLTTLYFHPRDALWLADVHERYVILTPEKSYFGLVQLYAPASDFKP